MGNKELDLTAALSTLYRGGPELFRKKNEPNTFCPKKSCKMCNNFVELILLVLQRQKLAEIIVICKISTVFIGEKILLTL